MTEAKIAFSLGCELAGLKEESFVALQEPVETDYIATHYAKLTEGLGVEVRWINRAMGKGLFATRAVRMFQPVFSEDPLISHRKLTSSRAPEATAATHPSCACCLRTFVSEAEVKQTRLKSQWERVYGTGPDALSAPRWTWCDDCAERSAEVVTDIERTKISDASAVRDPFVTGNPFFLERYCSAECKGKALAMWHRCLCGAKFVSDEQRVHPLHHLYNLCVETRRSNPLMIARIYVSHVFVLTIY